MRKKGVELVLTEIVGIVLVGILLILTAYVGVKLFSLFFTQVASEEATFESLSVEIKNLMKEKNPFSAKAAIPLILGGEYAIVAFDADVDWSRTEVDYCRASREENNGFVEKPERCGSFACICLYKEDDGILGFGGAPEFNDPKDKEDDLVHCVTFLDANVKFYTQYAYGHSYFSGKGRESPGYYDECGGGVVKRFGNDEFNLCRYSYPIIYGMNDCNHQIWGEKTLYIEKMRYGRNIQIYVSEYTEGPIREFLNKRMNYLNEKHNKPEAK